MSLRRLRSFARCALVLAFCGQISTAGASDVPYVPTPMNVVDAMLALGGVGPDDYLIDLGSGDGRIPIRAATRFGTRGMGVDLDAGLVFTARDEARRQGVQDRVVFEARDLFDTDLGRATVITAYLLHSVNLRLRPQLFAQLKPGTRIVTHDFDFGKWQPDQRLTIDVPDKAYGPPASDIMLWVIPADFSGHWQWTVPGEAGGARHELVLDQTFQQLQGGAGVGGRPLRLRDARVRGDTVRFTLGEESGGWRYAGRIEGDTISGEARREGAPPARWRAQRVKKGKMDISGM